jgi:hypothetical protein
MAAGVKLCTVQKWAKDLDPKQEWLSYDSTNGMVQSISCKLCKKHESKLKALRNFSQAFLVGVKNSALKKDNIVKHSKADMHTKAVNLENKPSIADIYSSTPIGRAVSTASAEDAQRVAKLIDISYVMAKEELHLTKYPKMAELEMRHGVQLGNTYITETKCQEFTCCIGEHMREGLIESLLNAEYFSFMLDGATDVSVQEKEAIFVLFLDKDGHVQSRFFCLKNVAHAHAEGLKQAVEDAFINLGIKDLNKHIVGMAADGANVNLGEKKGLVALLRKNSPWLIAIHCLNHRLELAAKDAFSGTYIDEILTMLTNLYAMYHRSPKRMRDLKALADIMEEHITMPQKANGTRWLQHKRRACDSLIRSYNVIVTHLENSAEDPATPRPDQAKIKG